MLISKLLCPYTAATAFRDESDYWFVSLCTVCKTNSRCDLLVCERVDSSSCLYSQHCVARLKGVDIAGDYEKLRSNMLIKLRTCGLTGRQVSLAINKLYNDRRIHEHCVEW